MSALWQGGFWTVSCFHNHSHADTQAEAINSAQHFVKATDHPALISWSGTDASGLHTSAVPYAVLVRTGTLIFLTKSQLKQTGVMP